MRWLLHNFWLKIIAFVMGLLVWFHVATEKTYNYELNLPIMEISLKEGLTLSQEPPDSLLVTVSATGKQLLRRKWRERGLRINASQYQAGRYSISLSNANTSMTSPSGDVSLDEIVTPVRIQLVIDAEATIEVPVTVDLDTEADDGFAIIKEAIVVPAQVTLTGPRSKLNQVTFVLTENKKLTGLRNNVTMTLPLVTPPSYGFKSEPDSVTVTIAVVPVKTRVFADLSVAVFNAPPMVSVVVDPAWIEVELTGPPSDIDALDPSAVTISVDYKQMAPSGLATVKVDCPPGFRVKRTSADIVRILTEADADTGN